ncbi:hypothetical protein B0G80_6167 [Paraburkholderia sp. BL6669N2]|nr:hypothetical protein B0G80_6167 [Paraburkholderia sp. BL6669N2]
MGWPRHARRAWHGAFVALSAPLARGALKQFNVRGRARRDWARALLFSTSNCLLRFQFRLSDTETLVGALLY